MKRITVDASKKYDVIIDSGILGSAGEYFSEISAPCSVMLVSDDNVFPIYGEKVGESLKKCGFNVFTFVFPHGEASKNTSVLLSLWGELARHNFTRTDMIAALGGGVTGDMAGFAAATFLRGIKYIQLPTSLLAMVDSSVGGKTAIDLPEGKNLAGAFYQPSYVLCDTNTLASLPELYFEDGMGEVIKYAVINRRELFYAIDGGEQTENIISACVEDKRDIVEADERDAGVRQLLNLGHTAAHGIELCSGYSIPHGHAVAAGLAIILRAAVKEGLCLQSEADEVIRLLKKFNLPVSCGYSAEELASAAMNDKKRQGGKITLVVPHGIGDTVLTSVGTGELERIFSLGL